MHLQMEIIKRSPHKPSNPSRWFRVYKLRRQSGRGESLNEAELIVAAQRSDLVAMGELYRIHRLKAYQTALIILRDPNLADDIVQEAFIRAFRAIGRCDPARSFAPWLTTILVNLCRNALRRERRLVPMADLSQVAKSDPGYAAVEAQTDAWQFLQQLPPHHREILMLRYFNEFSVSEIAEILGLPSGTVKSRLYAARQEMKRLLGRRQPVDGREEWQNG